MADSFVPSPNDGTTRKLASKTRTQGADTVHDQSSYVTDGAGNVIGISAAPFRTDPTGTTAQPITDNAGSLTVDSPGLPVALDGSSLKVKEQSPLSQGLTDAQLAARLPLSVEQATSVTVDAGTGPFPVSDNSGSLTVDAPVGTPAFVRLSDGSAAWVGQKASAASLPVVVASDQSAVPVSGTFYQATQPVSGTVTANAGTGTLAVSGPVTDTQIRATPLPVSGTVTANQAAATTSTGTITGSGQTVVLAVPAGASAWSFAGIPGTWTGSTLQFEGSADGGTTYAGIPMQLMGTAVNPTAITSIAGIASIAFQAYGPCGGLTHVRVRCSAYTASDSVPVTLAASQGLQALSVFGNVTADTELPAAAAQADGQANPTTPPVAGFGSTFNATTWDRLRGNVDGTAITSAARTATNQSSDIVNYNARGIQIMLNVTSAGTGSIQANVQGKDPVSASYYKLAADPTAVTTAALFVYEFYPGASTAAAGGITARVAASLPRTFRVIVTHGNANTITYSVGYSLIL